MISSFAWRNLWRNKLRSLVIIAAVSLGIFAGIFLISFMNGMLNARIQSIVGIEMSHVQIHQHGFLDNNQFTLQINNADSILNKVRTAPHVLAASKRIIINCMVASAETGSGVKVTGIDPGDEKNVTQISSKVSQGKYLDETGKNSVVISEFLAGKLKVGLKNKIIITVQDVNNTITGGAFRIVGIYQTDNQMFDESTIFIRNMDLSKLTGLSTANAHEIAIKLDDNNSAEATSKILAGYFPGLEVKDWQTLSPEAGYLVSAMTQYMYIFLVIILLALSFGIVNTMLMVIMERVHELGMLMAIGMNRTRIFLMIMLETIFLSLTGGVLGIIIGFAVSKYLGKVGLNLYFWKDAFAELGYSTNIYPDINLFTMIITSVMVIIAGVISSLYPAYKALKLNPAESIRS